MVLVVIGIKEGRGQISAARIGDDDPILVSTSTQINTFWREGSLVKFRADPAEGYSFDYFASADGTYKSIENPFSSIVTDDGSVFAYFKPIETETQGVVKQELHITVYNPFNVNLNDVANRAQPILAALLTPTRRITGNRVSGNDIIYSLDSIPVVQAGLPLIAAAIITSIIVFAVFYTGHRLITLETKKVAVESKRLDVNVVSDINQAVRDGIITQEDAQKAIKTLFPKGVSGGDSTDAADGLMKVFEGLTKALPILVIGGIIIAGLGLIPKGRREK